LSNRLQLAIRLTIAARAQGDSQTERMNAVLEQFLRAYISYLQDDWVDWLSLAEFSANSLSSETTRITLFFANYGFYPRLGIEPYEVPDMPTARRADTFANYMATILKFLREQILLVQACYEDSANRTRSTAPKFEVNQLV
jgi:hypothetical protein